MKKIAPLLVVVLLFFGLAAFLTNLFTEKLVEQRGTVPAQSEKKFEPSKHIDEVRITVKPQAVKKSNAVPNKITNKTASKKSTMDKITSFFSPVRGLLRRIGF